MSTSYSTYIGPYVQCQVSFVDAQELFFVCPNPHCVNTENELSSMFCPCCGTPRSERTWTMSCAAVDSDAVGDHIRHVLHSPFGDGYTTWVDHHHVHL